MTFKCLNENNDAQVLFKILDNAMKTTSKNAIDISGLRNASKQIQNEKETTKKKTSSVNNTNEKNTPIKRGRKSSNRKISKQADDQLSKYVNQLNIKQFDLFPRREYPTPFTRLPLFSPSQRKKAREAQTKSTSEQDFVELKSTWDKGGVYKSGPALTVFDEDTFIAMLNMRMIALVGPSNNMPSKRMERKNNEITSGFEASNVLVHAGHFLVTDLETFIMGKKPPKKGWPGTNITRRKQSIERLAATILKFTQPHGLDKYRGKQLQMITLDWIGDKTDACYYFELHPALVSWLNDYKSYVDIEIRRQLTPFGKALHRFLSSQTSNACYIKSWADVLEAIGYIGKESEAKRKAMVQLEKLKELSFIVEGSINGNGRATPYTLVVKFK